MKQFSESGTSGYKSKTEIVQTGCYFKKRRFDLLSHIILFHFISFAKTKHNKQTNKQKERWQGHRNSCGQLQRARIQIKRKKKRNI